MTNLKAFVESIKGNENNRVYSIYNKQYNSLIFRVTTTNGKTQKIIFVFDFSHDEI